MRIGLVGYGTGGRYFHTPFIQAASEWNLVGVVTRSAARRTELAADAPGVPAFDSLDALIDAGVDAVVISTPPDTRRALVLRALERGVHVVADKPFAPDLAVAQELAVAAERARRTLTVFHNRRWDTDFVTLREVVRSGAIGEPWRFRFVLDQDQPGTLDAGGAGGLLRDLGAHLVDQAVQLLGPVARVDAHLDWLAVRPTAQPRPVSGELPATATVPASPATDPAGEPSDATDVGFELGLHHESGAYSSLAASKLGFRSAREMAVYGSRGSYSSDMHDVQAEQVFAGERPATATRWGSEDEARWGVVRTATETRRVPSAQTDYTDYYRALHRALAEGEPLAVTIPEALHTVAVLDAARVSAAEGRSVALG